MTEIPIRIIIAGGGTAGHIVPGLAVAKRLKEIKPDIELTWVGVKGRSEEDLVPRQDVPLRVITARSLRRGFTPSALLSNIRAAGSSVYGVIQSIGVLRRCKPQLVIGMGGYVCFSVMLGAKLMGIPTIICEQNSVPGLTVRLVSKFADRIAVTYEQTGKYLKEQSKIRVTGNPVATELLHLDKTESRAALGLPADKLILLVFGGSLGSSIINSAIASLIRRPQWREHLAKKWFIFHSTGPKKFEEVRELSGAYNSYRPEPYIYENYKALAAADAIVSRAGASTLAEITVRGIPALLIPWPGAAHDHQTKNAQFLMTEGAADMIFEQDFSEEVVVSFLEKLSCDTELRQAMADRTRKLARADAADRIIDVVEELLVQHGYSLGRK